MYSSLLLITSQIFVTYLAYLVQVFREILYTKISRIFRKNWISIRSLPRVSFRERKIKLSKIHFHKKAVYLFLKCVPSNNKYFPRAFGEKLNSILRAESVNGYRMTTSLVENVAAAAFESVVLRKQKMFKQKKICIIFESVWRMARYSRCPVPSFVKIYNILYQNSQKLFSYLLPFVSFQNKSVQ